MSNEWFNYDQQKTVKSKAVILYVIKFLKCMGIKLLVFLYVKAVVIILSGDTITPFLKSI